MNDQDRDLERRFAELREWDRRHTPGFDAVVGAVRVRPRPWLPLAAAAALIVAGTLLILRNRKAPDIPVAAIVNWSSPTAALLTPPGAELLTTVPSLSASVIHLEVR